MPKIGPKIHKMEIWPIRPKNDRWNHEINALAAIFGKCLNYKSGLRILIWPTEVPFLVSKMTTFVKSECFPNNLFTFKLFLPGFLIIDPVGSGVIPRLSNFLVWGPAQFSTSTVSVVDWSTSYSSHSGQLASLTFTRCIDNAFTYLQNLILLSCLFLANCLLWLLHDVRVLSLSLEGCSVCFCVRVVFPLHVYIFYYFAN